MVHFYAAAVLVLFIFDRIVNVSRIFSVSMANFGVVLKVGVSVSITK